MASNFKPWVETPTPGQQVQSASVFESDEQRINGFKAGDPASALRVNSALRQANVVIAALMQFCDEVKTLPTDLSLLSTVTEVKNAIKDSIETLHNTTLTSAKEYTDTRETEINTQILNVQSQVTENKNDIATLIERVDEHDDEIEDLKPVAFSGSYNDLSDKPNLDLKAPLESPTFTGTPTAPTPSATDDSTKIATTSFVQTSKMFKLVRTEPYSAGTPFSLYLENQGSHPLSAWYIQFSSDVVQIRWHDNGASGFRVSATGSTLTITPLAETGFTSINIYKYCGLRVLCSDANDNLTYQVDGCWSIDKAVLGEFGRANSPSQLKFYSTTAGTAYLYRVGADV